MSTTDDKYWAEYDGLQHAKHQLLRNYLGGWFPILASWKGRVLYIDCHAGRGRHDTGQEGSPILALKLLLEHNHRDGILSSTEVGFHFFEKDKKNYDNLCDEIVSLGTLPPKISISVYEKDYEEELRNVIADIRSRGSALAPSFAFVDPYGFTLSMDLLNELISFPECEILINFMYRYVDMAIHNPDQAANMDSLFGCSNWRDLLKIKDHEQRAEETISLFSNQLRAEYVTNMYMRAANNTLKYVLIHATNHRRGRELMKRAIWSITPDGSFTASERDSTDQPVLIILTPDLKPLEDALWGQFAGNQVSMEEIYEWLLGEIYLTKHLHQVLRDYRQKGIVNTIDYSGRFAFSKNPTIIFPTTRPSSE